MKRILFSLLFLSFGVFLYAQNSSKPQNNFRPQWFIGAKGGATISMVNFKPSVGQGFTFGASYGPAFRYLSHKNVGLQFELLYNERGWKEAETNYNRKLSYLSLPFMTHINFGGRIVRCFVNIGPEIGYLCKEKGIVKDSEIPQYQAAKNKFDYGIVGGLGLEIRTKIVACMLEGRYYFGIGNIYGARTADHFNTSSNQSIAINLAILFGM